MNNDSTKYANSIFEQPWFLDAVAPGKWKDITISEDDEIVARWPIYIEGNSIEMPPQTQTLGPWIKPGMSLTKQKELINQMIEEFPEAKNISLMLDPSIDYFLPFRWLGFSITPRVTYRLTDLTDLESVKRGFDKSVKKNLKSAGKKVQVVEQDNIDDLYEVLELTFKLQKRKYPYSKKMVKRIFDAAREHNAVKVLTAVDDNGNTHASSLFLYDENTCYYLISGANPDFRSSGAQSLVLWEAIQFASTVSANFDFEGSMIEGIERFFRRFGSGRTEYYCISRKNMWGEIKDVMKPHIKAVLGYKN